MRVFAAGPSRLPRPLAVGLLEGAVGPGGAAPVRAVPLSGRCGRGGSREAAAEGEGPRGGAACAGSRSSRGPRHLALAALRPRRSAAQAAAARLACLAGSGRSSETTGAACGRSGSGGTSSAAGVFRIWQAHLAARTAPPRRRDAAVSGSPRPTTSLRLSRLLRGRALARKCALVAARRAFLGWRSHTRRRPLAALERIVADSGERRIRRSICAPGAPRRRRPPRRLRQQQARGRLLTRSGRRGRRRGRSTEAAVLVQVGGTGSGAGAGRGGAVTRALRQLLYEENAASSSGARRWRESSRSAPVSPMTTAPAVGASPGAPRHPAHRPAPTPPQLVEEVAACAPRRASLPSRPRPPRASPPRRLEGAASPCGRHATIAQGHTASRSGSRAA
eukprot:tig00021432_g21250.t1